jgi:hypothetical protein
MAESLGGPLWGGGDMDLSIVIIGFVTIGGFAVILLRRVMNGKESYGFKLRSKGGWVYSFGEEGGSRESAEQAARDFVEELRND